MFWMDRIQEAMVLVLPVVHQEHWLLVNTCRSISSRATKDAYILVLLRRVRGPVRDMHSRFESRHLNAESKPWNCAVYIDP